MSKDKSIKRRKKAISCLMIQENLDTGYHKYSLDIQDEQGRVTTGIPAYGVDMQDAIGRLIKRESKEKFAQLYSERIEPIMLIAIAASWITSVALSTIMKNHPEYAFYGTVSMLSLLLVYAVYNFIKNFSKK